MLKLREPSEKERPWTHEAKYYGWAGFDLAARSHRMAGNRERADQIQQQFHAYGTPTNPYTRAADLKDGSGF